MSIKLYPSFFQPRCKKRYFLEKTVRAVIYGMLANKSKKLIDSKKNAVKKDDGTYILNNIIHKKESNIGTTKN